MHICRLLIVGLDDWQYGGSYVQRQQLWLQKNWGSNSQIRFRGRSDNGQWHSFPLGYPLSTEKWNIRRYFRAAYRPGGNRIVEGHHRTVKAIAKRGGMTLIEATIWYNMAPKIGQREETVPQWSSFHLRVETPEK